MSKLVDEIKLIIKNENIEKLCGYKYDNYISFTIDVCDISKNDNIEESFKEYIQENDYWNDSEKAKNYNKVEEELKKYEIEELKYWIDDLYILLGFTPGIFTEERLSKAIKLVEKLQECKAKAYRLVNMQVDDGELHEYSYTKGEVLGAIRCYETEKERFIIAFHGCD